MIRLIAAIDRQKGIGKHGGQPWNIPEDEQHFTDLTKSHGAIILVGSTTFQTFKGPLADRKNYVLTHDKNPIDGVETVQDLKKFLRDFQSEDLWVIGGANLFSQVIELGLADELYLTKIEADFGCHQFFPTFEDHFALSEQGDLREQNGFVFSYATYTKTVA